MGRIRHAAVAGIFYPDSPEELATMVEGYLSSATGETDCIPKAIVVPHAGYIYSGPVAAQAYHLLQGRRTQIKRVVLLGPSHRVPLLGLAASSAEFFETPLGEIPVDKEAMERLLTLPQICPMDQAHMMEHSLEVQLPFLQTVLDEFSLIPLVVGDASAEEIGEVLEQLWDGDTTLVVVSSDLSHYHSYDSAREMDAHTAAAIESLRPDDIHYEDACGRNPIKGLLHVAKKLNLSCTTVGLANSGDTAGDKSQVVGYGAFCIG